MLEEQKEQTLHEFYTASLVIKGLSALIETISGLLVFFISHDYVIRVILSLTDGELSQDPNDFFAHHLYLAAQNFSVGSQMFAAFYLLSHGIIKLILIIALFKNKMWAYPASILFIGFFTLYEMYKFIFTQSLWMLGFTIFDILVLSLIFHEYRRVLKRIPKI